MEHCSNGLPLLIAEVRIIMGRDVPCFSVFVWLFRRSQF